MELDDKTTKERYSMLMASHQYPRDQREFDGIQLQRLSRKTYTTKREATNEATSRFILYTIEALNHYIFLILSLFQ